MRINKYIAHVGVASRRKGRRTGSSKLFGDGQWLLCELATIIKTGDQAKVEGTPIYKSKKGLLS